MAKNTGYQAPAVQIDHHKQESHCDRHEDLKQNFRQIHATAVKQVQNMAQTKSHTGYQNRRPPVLLCHCFKEKSPEDQFLQETHTSHKYNVESQGHGCQVHHCTIPKIGGTDQNQRQIKQHFFAG